MKNKSFRTPLPPIVHFQFQNNNNNNQFYIMKPCGKYLYNGKGENIIAQAGINEKRETGLSALCH